MRPRRLSKRSGSACARRWPVLGVAPCSSSSNGRGRLSDLLPHIAVPTLLIWGQVDARSPLTVAYQFQEAIADTKLLVIEGAGHMSNLERPDRVNDAVRELCRAHAPHPR